MCCGRHGTPCRPSAGSPSLPPSPMTCQLPPILAPPPRATASGALPLPLPPRRHAVSMSSMTPLSSTLCGPPVGPDIKKSLKLLRTHVPLKIKSYFECGCSPRCRPALCRRIGERNKCRQHNAIIALSSSCQAALDISNFYRAAILSKTSPIQSLNNQASADLSPVLDFFEKSIGNLSLDRSILQTAKRTELPEAHHTPTVGDVTCE